MDKMGRDNMFYKICDIDITRNEDLSEILSEMKNISNPNFQDYEGVSYLHMACQAHSLEAIKILLELGANPNLNDNYESSPVTWALGSLNINNKAILELMLQYGLDLYKKERGQTLIEWIKMFKNDEYNAVMKNYI
jgi:ankyrin repeat protein